MDTPAETPSETQKVHSPMAAFLRLVVLAILQLAAFWLVTKLFPSVPCNTSIDGAGCQPTPTFDQQLTLALVGVIFVPFAIWAFQAIVAGTRKVRPIARWLAILVSFGLTAWISWQSLVTLGAFIGRLFHG